MINKLIKEKIAEGVFELYNHVVQPEDIQDQRTRKEFEGDITIVVFPFTRIAKKSPESIGKELGAYLQKELDLVSGFNVIKGFLNISIHDEYWLQFLSRQLRNENYGRFEKTTDAPVVIEFSSPNTNKPLHLGHIRNNLLGYSIAKINEANGKTVKKVNLVNDRGIHICKSMLAWEKFGKGETPVTSGKKGDKFVGDYYVKFDRENRNQVKQLMMMGNSEEEAANTDLMKEARDLLKKWEAGDEKVRSLWEKMNSWVYEGFDKTYKRMGIDFDKIYYESETYLLGKELVKEGLEKNIFFQKENGSVWADLSDKKLDEKLLLRDDGTSVYMTQDLGTAQLRYDDFKPRQLLYVVGNEQNYHFEVLKIILEQFGKEWAKNIKHISYGMVELPEGKMKSREGTVVDADDLMEEMHRTARETTLELGKIDSFTDEEAENLFETIGMGALKYFILKVDPKKNMLFNPEESIQFDGNTGPFIQYTYARIQSLLRKAKERGLKSDEFDISGVEMLDREKQLLKLLHTYPEIVKQAGEEFSPAQVANYIYELVKTYNGFYQDTPVLREEDPKKVAFRILLSKFTGQVIISGMELLGIEVPERM